MPVKLPAFQVYPGDWRKDLGVQSLSYHDRGVWWELICLMHESEQRGLLILNGHAMSDESIARLLGLDNQILTTTLTNLLTSGVASRDEETGALMCRRMVRDEKTRQVRAEAGKLGGNPALLNHEVNQKPTTGVKQNPTPSSSSSTSNTPVIRATHAHCLKLQQELSIPASMGQIAPLLQLIDFEAQIRGDPEKATDWLIAQGKEARVRGETVNVWWFTNKKYEGNGGQSEGNRKARTSGNYEALRRSLEELPEESADGPGGSTAGGNNRGNVEVIRPPSGQVRA